MAERIRRSKTKVRRLAMVSEMAALDDLIGELPGKNEVIRFVTLNEFSATGLINWICDRQTVDWFGCVTLRVGKRCSALIEQLVNSGKIKSADFILGHLSAERHGAEREAANVLQEICDEKGWTLMAARNHAKVLLFKTAEGGFYVVETSANLNDLPNWEQFLVENDEGLFNWYKDLFFGSGLTYPMPEEKKEPEDEWDDRDNPWTCLSLRGKST